MYPGDRNAVCPFDPSPLVTELSAREPLSKVSLWDGSTAWLVNRHADQASLLRDARISADNTLPDYPHLNEGQKLAARRNRTFMTLDGAEHRWHRRHFTGEFTVRRVRAMRPRIASLIDGLLDSMEEQGPPADLVTAFATPLPTLVICELLGVPYDDHAYFQERTNTFVDTSNPPELTVRAAEDLAVYLGHLVEQKIKHPADDLLSRMIERVPPVDEETREGIVHQARLLLVAGHETMAATLALGVCTLLRHPDQLALVREGSEEQVTTAVDELLRYASVVHKGRRRVALADISIGGEVIREGEGVIMPIESGNRDPLAFKDPDRLDLTREARHHLAFGSGPHQCLAQNLAHTELQLAYPALLRRFPNLRLAVPFASVPFRGEMAVYGVHELPLTW